MKSSEQIEMELKIEGEVECGPLFRALYATDASIYRKEPLGVVYPKHEADVVAIIKFADQFNIPLIPRTAGTSLAGQCVGAGLIVDVSRHMNTILEFNEEESWVRVQPGVIRDELNAFLKDKEYFFGPITSTASRAMIGGMVGNNSSGTTSIKYGVTRDHVLELRTVLSNGSVTTFGDLTPDDFEIKMEGNGLEAVLYRQIFDALNSPKVGEEIKTHFPKSSIHRRNTGYAVDSLLETSVFTDKQLPFNFSKLLCGSEGTLAFTTEIKIHVDPLPPPFEILVCAHFDNLTEALESTLVVMEHQPFGCELMDKAILDCTKENREQQKNRFFLEGDPGAILIIEVRGNSVEEAESFADAIIQSVETSGYGYAFPKVYPPKTKQVLALRAAGFGVLSNVKGDDKPIEFVEDTAVALPDLPSYINEFQELMKGFGQDAIYYAHAGAGELHLRPRVNLKTDEGRKQLREIAEASAKLVKKYQGSLSGEHGDGRVRGEFIPLILGEANYALFKRIKSTWDPKGIFNPGKIVDADPMDSDFKYLKYEEVGKQKASFLNFEKEGGFLRLAEKCTGSGDCRKLANISGGVMCPSYMATRNEKDSTRARANALREFLQSPQDNLGFSNPNLKEVMDLCISCKGCTSECPSNVDMSVMKAEYLYQVQEENGYGFRSRFFAKIADYQKLGSKFPGLGNMFLSNRFSGNILKKILGVSPKRSLPSFSKTTWESWMKRKRDNDGKNGEIFLFVDEFINYSESEIGIKSVEVLEKLGYKIQWIPHDQSGRAAISKGLLKKARKHAIRNVKLFADLVSEDKPLVGLEPSAILTFRDEYLRLVPEHLMAKAMNLAKHCLTIEEFLAREIGKGRISRESFKQNSQKILVHGHCHQKALASQQDILNVLELTGSEQIEIIQSGCCGMAGSFGYEKEHFDISMKIGELVLFPVVRNAEEAIICAPGTSCRHQIADGTGKKALHPIEILFDALHS
ncbi:MAG: FAD-linked oxidase C-terminal domain-containing protein [Saprospiraceae bacterium]